LVTADFLRASQSIAATSGRLDVTQTTLETFTGGFRFAELAMSTRDCIAGFFCELDESLVAGEVTATGFLGATLRLLGLRLSASHGGSFDETITASKVGAYSLWRAALVLCTFGLSTSH